MIYFNLFRKVFLTKINVPLIESIKRVIVIPNSKYFSSGSGTTQWAIALVQIDIMYATVVILQYCPAHVKGHLSKIKHLYGYLNKYTPTSIKFNTETPDKENFKTIDWNWGNLYPGEPENLPHSCPPYMGKSVLITRFVGANIMAGLITGRFQTVIIRLLNKTPI